MHLYHGCLRQNMPPRMQLQQDKASLLVPPRVYICTVDLQGNINQIVLNFQQQDKVFLCVPPKLECSSVLQVPTVQQPSQAT